MSWVWLVLDLVHDLAPELWAALFWGVFCLLLIAWKRDPKDKEDDQ